MRFVIIGIVIAAAFTLYGLVDAAMSDPSRARGVSKPVWVVIVVVLPVIGAILWFTIGKGRGPAPAPVRAPDDDPRFSGTRMSNTELDAHMRELEDRLRELDAETFPGEQAADDVSPTGASDGGTTDSAGGLDGDVADGGPENAGGEQRPDRPGETPSSRQ